MRTRNRSYLAESTHRVIAYCEVHAGDCGRCFVVVGVEVVHEARILNGKISTRDPTPFPSTTEFVVPNPSVFSPQRFRDQGFP
jgi:hypothetical protein